MFGNFVITLIYISRAHGLSPCFSVGSVLLILLAVCVVSFVFLSSFSVVYPIFHVPNVGCISGLSISRLVPLSGAGIAAEFTLLLL